MPTPDADLIAAVEAKDAKALKAALAAGASASAIKPGGRAALLMALELKSKTLVKALLAAGADVKVTDKSGAGPLNFLATTMPDLDLLAAFVKAGANLNQLGGRDKRAPLHDAVLRPKLELAGALLDHGADIDVHDGDRGRTPLQLAIYTDTPTSHAAARWLMERGADINALDDSGDNALNVAARNTRNLELITALFDRGAKLVADKYGNTALHHAVSSTHARNKEIWDLLIAKGCDINARTKSGRTPLHTTASCWNPACVKYLLGKGADRAIKDEDGLTVLESAKKLGQTEIISLLEEP